MILDVFLNALRDADYGDSFTAPTHMAVGTGTTAPTASDTALETEIFPDGSNRSAISSRTKSASKKVRVQMLILAGEANGSNISEVGCSNAATSGTFKNRAIISPVIAKDASYELKIQVETAYSNV